MNKKVEEEQRKNPGSASYRKSKKQDLALPACRVTIDPTNLAVLECVEKQTRGTLTMHCPRKGWDLRFQAASEKKAAPPPSISSEEFLSKVKRMRLKERRSYKFPGFEVDLTTVSEAVAPPGKRFDSLVMNGMATATRLEVEVEIDVALFAKERKLAAEGRPNYFSDLCR
eukprot:Sspe_Gene.87957::Locus_60041_Transcript_1_1_Confidence_1.000_Length_882::g.87957::m.87957